MHFLCTSASGSAASNVSDELAQSRRAVPRPRLANKRQLWFATIPRNGPCRSGCKQFPRKPRNKICQQSASAFPAGKSHVRPPLPPRSRPSRPGLPDRPRSTCLRACGRRAPGPCRPGGRYVGGVGHDRHQLDDVIDPHAGVLQLRNQARPGKLRLRQRVRRHSAVDGRADWTADPQRVGASGHLDGLAIGAGGRGSVWGVDSRRCIGRFLMRSRHHGPSAPDGTTHRLRAIVALPGTEFAILFDFYELPAQNRTKTRDLRRHCRARSPRW